MSSAPDEADIGQEQALPDTDHGSEPVSQVSSGDKKVNGNGYSSQEPWLESDWEGEDAPRLKLTDGSTKGDEIVSDEVGSSLRKEKKKKSSGSNSIQMYEKPSSADGSLSTPDEALSVQVGFGKLMNSVRLTMMIGLPAFFSS